MTKKRPPPGPGTDTVARLRAQVEAATTPAEYEAARQAIRRAMPPQAADRTDLPEACARKREELFSKPPSEE